MKRGRSEAIPALLLSLSLSRRSRARDSKGRIGTGRRMRRTFVMDSQIIQQPAVSSAIASYTSTLVSTNTNAVATAQPTSKVSSSDSHLFCGYHVRHSTIKLCMLLTQPMFSPRCTSWTRELFHRRVHTQSSNVLPTRLENHQTSRGVQQHQIVIVFSSQFRVK